MSVTARTVFFGTGAFAVPILERLAADARIEIAAVVTAPPRPSGRGKRVTSSPVATLAARLGLATLTPERLRDPDVSSTLERLDPDLVVLADYGRLVPRAILELPRHGALNLHPSLLPRHRGATPIQAAILAGDEATGVTLMQMDAGLDTGPILAQVSVSLSGDETASELEDRLAVLAGRLLADSLGDLLSGALPAMPQPTDGATLTRPLRREDGALDPLRPTVELERQVRAYQPWPGAWLETVAGRLDVRRARAIVPHPGDPRSDGDSAPGLLRAVDGALVLTTADGLLELVEVLPAGGRVMSGAALLRGRPVLAGSRVPVRRVG